MGTIAAAVRELIALGVQGDALVGAIERMEAAQQATVQSSNRTAERRREWDRERKRSKGTGSDVYSTDEWIGLRVAVFRRDGGLCAYCDDHDGALMTADHVIPLSRGGAHDTRNLVCCCVPCNNSKRNLLLTEWPGRSTTRRHKPFDHLIGCLADA